MCSPWYPQFRPLAKIVFFLLHFGLYVAAESAVYEPIKQKPSAYQDCDEK